MNQIDTTIAEGDAALARHTGNTPDASQTAARDATEQQQPERAEREQRILAEALRDTASALEYEAVLDRILNNANRAILRDGADRIRSDIMLLDPPCRAGVAVDRSARVVARTVRAKGYDASRPTPKREFPVAEISGFCHMIASGESLLVRDTRATAGNGYRNRQIGERLGISVRKVEVHRRNIMDKLGARNVAHSSIWHGQVRCGPAPAARQL